jgi:ADP-ribose pyrophosphatase
MTRAVEPWRVLASRVTVADRWLKLREDRCQTPHGAIVETYHVIECADGVSVVALTAAGKLLLTREYRHGCGAIVTGLPAGSTDPADATAEAAARRELLEETGYGGGSFAPLLTFWANPARQNNKVTSFLATGVAHIAAPRLDPAEAVEVREADLAETLDRIGAGELIMSPTSVAALFAAAARLGIEGRGG